ncbi:MAG: type II toxin-antitoxin system PemK/MazF family toxin, partial [Arcobacteraceae bacterium]
FDKWNNLKKQIHKKKENIKFSQGNIYFMSVGHNIGGEIYGHDDLFLRPVLVYRKLSSNTFIGIPLTSKQKEGNYFFTFRYTKKTLSTALLNQMKVFDIKRTAYYDGYINIKDFTKLRDQVKEFVNITPNLKKKGNGHASKKLPKSLSSEIKNIITKKNKDVN